MTYNLREYNTNNYGYIDLKAKTLKTSSSSRGAGIFSAGNVQKITIKNKKNTGNLEIFKTNKYSNEPLENIKFKIKKEAKDENGNEQFIRAIGEKNLFEPTVKGKILLNDLEYTSNKEEATDFITDDNGKIQIYNILEDRYIAEEIEGPDIFGYELDDESVEWIARTKEKLKDLEIKLDNPKENVQFIVKRDTLDKEEYIQVLDENNNVVPNINYKIELENYNYTSKKENATIFTTDVNGEVKIIGLSRNEEYIAERVDKSFTYTQTEETVERKINTYRCILGDLPEGTRFLLKAANQEEYVQLIDQENNVIPSVTGNSILDNNFIYVSKQNNPTEFIADERGRIKIDIRRWDEDSIIIPECTDESIINYSRSYTSNIENETINVKKIEINGNNAKEDFIIKRDTEEDEKYLQILDENNGFIKNISSNVEVNKYDFTKNLDEATIFTTDENGKIIINNLDNTVDYIAEKKINLYETFKITSRNNDNNGMRISDQGQGKEVLINLNRQSSNETSNNNSGIFDNQISITNEKKYIKISGYAWEDNISGKNSLRNNLYDKSTDNNESDDNKLANIKVNLYKKDGTLLDTRITDVNGDYKFGDYINDKKKDENGNEITVDKIKIEDIDGAYIEFEYNGMNYETTDIIMKKDDQNNITDIIEDNSSKVRENTSKNEMTRELFNNNYKTIEYNKSNEKELIYEYNKNDYSSKLKLGDNVKYGYDNQVLPISGVYEQYKMTANTFDANAERLLGQNLTLDDIRKKDISVISNVNLGLRRREMPDLAISTDINNVEVSINGYKHIYSGNERMSDESRSTYSQEEGAKNAIFNATVKADDKYRELSYSRELYESDCKYMGNDVEKPFELYMTYEVKIINEATNLYSIVNSIVNYYDKDYLIPYSYKIDNRDTTEQIEINSEEYNGKYNKLQIKGINLGINPGKEKSIFIKFKLIKYEGIIYDTELKKDVAMLNDYTEITSYSTKDVEGKVYGGIDKDSNADNLTSDNEMLLNEDDSDKAPEFKIVFDKARQIQGTVFLDNLIEDKKGGPNKEKQGNGIYDQGEKTIKGVKVGLYRITDFDEDEKLKVDSNGKLPKPSGTTYYTSKISEDDKTIEINGVTYYHNENGLTAEDGEFIITDFIPGEYKLVYIWGDGNYSVEEYKGTIWTKNNLEEKYVNGDYNGTENIQWYRNNIDSEGKLKEKNIRYTDAKDNWKIRENNDSIMQSTTNKLNFAVELMDDINSINETNHFETYSKLIKNELKFIIPDIDFGIVEKAKQSLAIHKKVENINIILANGQNVINAKFDNDGNLIGTVKGVNYAPAQDGKSQIWISLDSELIQGSKAEISYKLSVKNNSEKDYSTKDYYYYGITDDNYLIKLQPDGVYDYLDNTMTLDPESNNIQDNGKWEIKTLDEYNTYTEDKIEPTIIEKYLYDYYSNSIDNEGTTKEINGYESYEKIYSEVIKEWKNEKIEVARKKRLLNKTILHNSKLEDPIEVGGENSVILKVTKMLSNKEDIDLNNESEIVRIKDEKKSNIIIYPIIEELYDKAENIVISTNPGRTDYTIEIMEIILICLVITALGIIIILKKHKINIAIH